MVIHGHDPKLTKPVRPKHERRQREQCSNSFHGVQSATGKKRIFIKKLTNVSSRHATMSERSEINDNLQ